MKLKNVSCTQFAGVRDWNVSLQDGLNVIYGKNESGKSTLVNLIARTLFQTTRLDRRSHKEFIDRCFPCAVKGGTAGDFADGRVSFETAHGLYTLSKEWGADPRLTLSTPNGVIRDPATVDALLKEALLYGEGVYADLLFSPQSSTEASLRALLDVNLKTDAKQEWIDAVSQAMAESDGVSMDAVEQAIDAKIEEIGGKHWDYDRGAPVRKAGRWATGLGDILKAYYALEDAREVLCEITKREEEADRAAAEYTQADAVAKAAQEAFDTFHAFAGSLALQSERKKAVDRLEAERRKFTDILSVWPLLDEQLARAKDLRAEQENRTLLDAYAAAKTWYDEYVAAEQALQKRVWPTEAELDRVRAACRTATALENRLCGMNLNAVVTLFDGHDVQITSLRSGERVGLQDGKAAITEAVTVTVPGVMEMQLSPADVDAATVEKELASCRAAVQSVLARYEVSGAEELEQLVKEAAKTIVKRDTAKERLLMLLGNTPFSQLEEAALAVPAEVRTAQEIERDILSLCGSNDAARFITMKETVAAGYAADYGSIGELKIRAFDLSQEFEKAKAAATALQDIPEAFANVVDPEAQLEMLRDRWQQAQEKREQALTSKTAALSKLEGFKETQNDDPREQAEKAKRVFDETQSLLRHWMHIREVFFVQKSFVRDNPMSDMTERFLQYLSEISSGKITSDFPDEDKLQVQIFSANRQLDYATLSEGTKETVLLAFRLAVLDHLFPNGGGVIVFDDPFADMDEERAARSSALIRACASRHQVIFLTCHEAYAALLGGHTVQF